jgi:hypothetical protein
MLSRTARSLLGGNHRKINKELQNLDYRNRRSYDNRRKLDAAISGIHDKQNATQRHGRSKKDNTMIQDFHRVTRKNI